MPTEYLEEHGPDRVRELAVGLASLLSFSTGHGGLAFELYGMRSRALPLIREALLRHPGLDLPQPSVELALGAWWCHSAHGPKRETWLAETAFPSTVSWLGRWSPG